MGANLNHSFNGIGKRLCMQNAVVPFQVLKPLKTLQVSVSLPWLNVKTRGKLADKCHHISNRIFFFS